MTSDDREMLKYRRVAAITTLGFVLGLTMLVAVLVAAWVAGEDTPRVVSEVNP